MLLWVLKIYKCLACLFPTYPDLFLFSFSISFGCVVASWVSYTVGPSSDLAGVVIRAMYSLVFYAHLPEEDQQSMYSISRND
jgi:hypothetical protein